MFDIGKDLQDAYEAGYKAGQQDKWIPYNIAKPQEDGWYFITVPTRKGDLMVMRAFFSEDFIGIDDIVIAWMLSPEPYRG